MDESSRKILLRLEALCSRAEMCSSAVYDKALKAFGDERDAAERATEVLDSLIADKFVDDLRYASAFAREKSSLTGWGPIKISYALAAKKIDRATIKKALGEVDESRAADRLRALLEAKWKTLRGPDGKTPEDARLKLIKFALSRGYEYDAVKDTVQDICSRHTCGMDIG